MPKKCQFVKDGVDCTNNQFGGKYCRMHQYMRTDLVKAIPQRSKRREVDDLTYKKKRAKFLSLPENRFCVSVPVELRQDDYSDIVEGVALKEGCTFYATTIQHTQGREGDNFLDEETWLPSCSFCNLDAEKNDAEAREVGFKKSKHAGWQRKPKI